MKVGFSFVTLFLCAACAAALEASPTQKVVQLLEGMLAKGKAEKHDEQVQFAAYEKFCDATSGQKEKAVKIATEKIESLKADIELAASNIAALSKEIAALEKDMSIWEADIKKATKERETAAATFKTTNKDYSESISALERAILVLQKQAYDRKQQDSFAQVAQLKTLKLIPTEAKNSLDAFLDQGSSEAAELAVFSQSGAFAPETNAYEFQSNSIIDMLQKLLDKFTEERTALQKAEMESKHDFDSHVMDLKAQISSAEIAIKTKSGVKAENMQAKAAAEADFTDTAKTKAEDETYLADLTSTCSQKATDFEARQQLRTEELESIEEAIGIISSAKVTSAASKYLDYSLAQKNTAFAQLRGDVHVNTQKRVAEFLQKQADRLNSRILSTIAVRAAEDPFLKVKKMIKQLMTKLLEEANEEAAHKGWCDAELATNKATRDEKGRTVEKLTAEIEGLTSSIAQLKEDIAELSKALAALDGDTVSITSMREKEKEENAQTVKDAVEAQAAIAQALTILKNFYDKAAGATALMQKAQGAAASKQRQPAIFDSPYTGMQGRSGGVVAMLQVIQSDFAKLEVETKSAEMLAQKGYEKQIADNTIDKKAKETSLEHKKLKKTDDETALVSRKSDLEGTQAELDTANTYWEKLKPSCGDATLTFDERMSRRQEEITSLKESLKILNGLDFA